MWQTNHAPVPFKSLLLVKHQFHSKLGRTSFLFSSRHMNRLLAINLFLITFLFQVKNAEEKARKALTDASRLGEELRSEQEHGMAADKAAKVLAAQSAGLNTAIQSCLHFHGR